MGDGLTVEFWSGWFARVTCRCCGFVSRKADGSPTILEPYLRMLGHAVVMRSDGSVFAHVHPAGTLSMSAARRFAVRSGGEGLGRETDANCGDLEAVPGGGGGVGRTGEVQFPYVFPQSGTYWVWVQVRGGWEDSGDRVPVWTFRRPGRVDGRVDPAVRAFANCDRNGSCLAFPGCPWTRLLLAVGVRSPSAGLRSGRNSLKAGPTSEERCRDGPARAVTKNRDRTSSPRDP